MPTPTAPLIAPYTSPPPKYSLSLLTSVLGATSNWLILRFLCDALGQRGRHDDGTLGDGTVGPKRSVVLVSFMRDWDFWRTEARRIGLDLARLAHDKRFAFVDGFSELFAQGPEKPTRSSPLPPAATTGRHAAVDSRRPQQQQNGPLPGQRVSGGADGRRHSGWKKLRWSKEGGLDAMENDIVSAINGLNGEAMEDTETGNDVLLAIDQPDFLLAATGTNMGVGGTELSETIMGLRQHVHSTIVTAAADSPLMHSDYSSSPQPTPLETEHTSFVVTLAHQSRLVMQLRELDTGVARDVSGVLRISGGGKWEEESQSTGTQTEHSRLEEKEVLYFVQGDGAVRAFGRGE